MDNSNRSKKITVRYSEEEKQILDEKALIYNMTKSEVVRLGIRKLNERGVMDILPQLCKVCSIVNEIFECAEVNEKIKDNLRKELNNVWKILE